MKTLIDRDTGEVYEVEQFTRSQLAESISSIRVHTTLANTGDRYEVRKGFCRYEGGADVGQVTAIHYPNTDNYEAISFLKPIEKEQREREYDQLRALIENEYGPFTSSCLKFILSKLEQLERSSK